MAGVDDNMVCPGCGASVSLQDKTCDFCGRKLTFVSMSFKAVRRATYRDSTKFLEAYKGALEKSPDNPEVLASLGYVLLDSGRYREAADALDKAVANGADDSDVLFHAALARFKCKKPFQIKLQEAQSLIDTIDSAISMNPLPQYFYTKAEFIRILFEQRYLKYSERSVDVLSQATDTGLSDADRMDVDSILTEASL